MLPPANEVVAQLVRVSVSKTEGSGFESLLSRRLFNIWFFRDFRGPLAAQVSGFFVGIKKAQPNYGLSLCRVATGRRLRVWTFIFLVSVT